MKNVLIVDDEKNLRDSLQDAFREHAEEFSIHTAENGAKATVLLSLMPVDLVITDLKMPVMDGFELLAYMSKHNPKIPTIVMTAHSRIPDIADKLKHCTASRYLQKPFDLEVLASMIVSELKFQSPDLMKGLTLHDFLELMETEERTGTLSIEFGQEKAVLYFRQGVLLDAETGGLFGDHALCHMAGWDYAKIDISPECLRTINRISVSFHELFMKWRGCEGGQTTGEPVPAELPAGADAAVDSGEIDPGFIDGELLLKEIDMRKEQEAAAANAGERPATTRGILSELANLKSIEAVCLVSRDGFLLDSIGRGSLDKEMIGAIASSGFGASDSMGRRLDKGVLQTTMIEFEKGPVILAPIGDDAFLVIVADHEANLGMIRLKLKKHNSALVMAAAAI